MTCRERIGDFAYGPKRGQPFPPPPVRIINIPALASRAPRLLMVLRGSSARDPQRGGRSKDWPPDGADFSFDRPRAAPGRPREHGLGWPGARAAPLALAR